MITLTQEERERQGGEKVHWICTFKKILKTGIKAEDKEHLRQKEAIHKGSVAGGSWVYWGH